MASCRSSAVFSVFPASPPPFQPPSTLSPVEPVDDLTTSFEAPAVALPSSAVVVEEVSFWLVFWAVLTAAAPALPPIVDVGAFEVEVELPP